VRATGNVDAVSYPRRALPAKTIQLGNARERLVNASERMCVRPGRPQAHRELLRPTATAAATD